MEQQIPLPSNPLLGRSRDAEFDLQSTARCDSQILSQLSSSDRTLDKSSLKQTSKLYERNSKTSWWKLWWQEIGAILLSLLLLAANIAMLADLDGRPNEKWQIARVDVTPNTIVSIISTFTKASLLLPVAEIIAQLKWLYFQARVQKVSDLQLFDDASRGPLGSLRLLWGVNLRSFIASMCAIITILALATEPFTQQVLRYPTRQSVATNASAELSFTKSLTSTDYNRQGGDGTHGQATYLQQLNVAINSGISKPADNTVFNCPSGSCSWPAYQSLGLCAYCQDYSRHTVISCSSVPRAEEFRLCNYTLSYSAQSIIYGQDPTTWLAWNVWVKADDKWEPSTWLNISSDDQSIFSTPGMSTDIFVLRFNQTYDSISDTSPDDIMPTSLRCQFKLCAQYRGQSQVYNGTLFDEPDFTVQLISNSNSGSYYPDPTIGLPAAQSELLNATNSHYDIDDRSSRFLQSMLGLELRRKIFNSTQALVRSYSDVFMRLPEAYQSEYLQYMYEEESQARRYTLYYANNGNIQRTLRNIAASVTSSFRSGPGSSNLTGTVTYPIVYIDVIWPWIIYPGVLIIVAAILLGVTIRISCEHGKVVWKSSILALLFHGLPDDEVDRTLLTRAKTEKAADDMWAQFVADEYGHVSLKIA